MVVNQLYRQIWLTSRNNFMVNTINNAVYKYYFQADKNKQKKKRNFVLIIGATHLSPQRGYVAYNYYKMGIHNLLTYPQLSETN